jgi:hypothetical protein
MSVGFAVTDGQREDGAQNESSAEEADSSGLTGGPAVLAVGLLRSPRCFVFSKILKTLLPCIVPGHGGGGPDLKVGAETEARAVA